MPWTKQALVDAALGELALQGFVFDLSPEERHVGLMRLEALMATWEQRGIRLGYVFGDKLSEQSGIPDGAAEPVFLNLAIRLAASYGKAVAPETRRQAREGFSLLLRAAAMPMEQQLPAHMPRGAGARMHAQMGRPFTPAPHFPEISVTEGGDVLVAPE